MRRILVIILSAVLASGPALARPVRPQTPVMVGGEEDFDACGGSYRIVGLNPRGDNFLSLRGDPATTGRELARLRAGQIVFGCETSGDGQWTGVVFPPPGSRVDCRVGTPIPERQPYAGPCSSGWVASRFLEIVAG